MKTEVAKALFKSHDYHEYRKLVSDLLLEGKATGNEQSENLVLYSNLNITRMNLLDKTIQITEENIEKLKSLEKRYIWLVLAEGWCADSAQIVPILNKMAHESGKIDLKIVLPEENEELMYLFMTNGVRSIPKVIIVDKESGTIYGSWGSRPKGANDFMERYKENHDVIDDVAKNEMQMWYLHDKGVSVQEELIGLMLDSEQQNHEVE